MSGINEIIGTLKISVCFSGFIFTLFTLFFAKTKVLNFSREPNKSKNLKLGYKPKSD